MKYEITYKRPNGAFGGVSANSEQMKNALVKNLKKENATTIKVNGQNC